MQYIEIEIRIHLEKDDELLAWLANKAKYIGISHQVDTYFQHPKLPFLIQDEKGLVDSDHWLRIRDGKKGAELCYKLWHRDPITKESLYADEIETAIGSCEAAEKLLQLLGYQPISTIDKTRESWKYGDFKFERDKVKGLGNFYEIEFCGETDDPATARKKIFELLNNIGISDWRRIDRGYPWMQWNGIR